MSWRFEIIRDAGAWSTALAEMPAFDFHHTHDFHAISAAAGEGSPLLLTGSSGTARIAWPLLEREIPGGGTDLGSVYGYPGPLVAGADPVDAIRAALDHLSGGAHVSVSARLHPIANRDLIDAAPEFVRRFGMIIAADLSRPEAELRKEIRGLKNGTIKKIERAGVTLRESRDPDDTATFQRIYRETMDRLDAAAYYYFSDAYIRALITATGFDTRMVFAEQDGVPCAAALMIGTERFAQYYLSGTTSDASALSPIALLLKEEIFAAQARGQDWFVLGGGLGGQEDGLARFKLGFAKTTFPAGLITAVLDREKYDALTAAAGLSADATGYFPAYRTPSS